MNSQRVRSGLSGLLLVSATLTVMAGSIISPVLVPLGKAFHLTSTETGMVITTHGVTIALVSLFAGRLIDRIGFRLPIALGLIIYGIAGGCGVIAPNFPLLLLTRIALGVGVAGIYTGITVAILSSYEGTRRDKILGLRGAANSVGGIVWPLLGGFLGSFAWNLPFAIYMVGLPLGALALMLIPAKSPESKSSQSASPTRQGHWFKRQLLAPYGLMLLANLFLYGVVVFFPQFLDHFSVTNTFLVSLFLAVAPIFSTLSASQYYKISARLSVRSQAGICLILWCLAFLLAALASSPLLLIFSAALFGLGQGIMFSTVVAWVDLIVGPRNRGAASSLISVFGYAGQFLSPLLLGPLSEKAGFTVMYGSLSAVAIIALALITILRPNAKGADNPR